MEVIQLYPYRLPGGQELALKDKPSIQYLIIKIINQAVLKEHIPRLQA